MRTLWVIKHGWLENPLSMVHFPVTVSVVSFLAPWDLVFTAQGGCVCQPRQALLGEASRGIRKGPAVEGGFAAGIR